MVANVYMYVYIYCIYIYVICEYQRKLYVKYMHKLGSSPSGCEDFCIPGGITNGVSV